MAEEEDYGNQNDHDQDLTDNNWEQGERIDVEDLFAPVEYMTELNAPVAGWTAEDINQLQENIEQLSEHVPFPSHYELEGIRLQQKSPYPTANFIIRSAPEFQLPTEEQSYEELCTVLRSLVNYLVDILPKFLMYMQFQPQMENGQPLNQIDQAAWVADVLDEALHTVQPAIELTIEQSALVAHRMDRCELVRRCHQANSFTARALNKLGQIRKITTDGYQGSTVVDLLRSAIMLFEFFLDLPFLKLMTPLDDRVYNRVKQLNERWHGRQIMSDSSHKLRAFIDFLCDYTNLLDEETNRDVIQEQYNQELPSWFETHTATAIIANCNVSFQGIEQMIDLFLTTYNERVEAVTPKIPVPALVPGRSMQVFFDRLRLQLLQNRVIHMEWLIGTLDELDSFETPEHETRHEVRQIIQEMCEDAQRMRSIMYDDLRKVHL